jgi:saccharopine dehydrogenase-like NADP-dependent oxidoreductase
MTEELLKLSPTVSNAKITAVFECGLDPGIDHIVTLMMIQKA